MVTKARPEPGETIANRYTLVRIIGEGSMGAVFEATDANDATGGNRLAIKVVSAVGDRKDAERQSRFSREATLLAQLHHEHVVPILDHGIDAPTQLQFLAMPLLQGADLGTILQREGALEPRVAGALCDQACQGLIAAHRAGIVHRDIKPSNLFLESVGDTARVRVLDFGLAKAGAEPGGLTASGAFLGTAHYVSPEQAIDAKRVGLQSDLWGLAMTLFHALAGEPAFARTGSFMALILELTGTGVRSIQDVAPWIEPGLARVVHGALLRDVNARCPSAEEFSLALRTAIGFDACTSAVRLADLRRVTDGVRTTKATRAELPASWDDVLRF